MVKQAELGDDNEEAEMPLVIVHLIKVEDYGNVSFDVDQLNMRNRSRVRDDLTHVELRGAEEDLDGGEDQEEEEAMVSERRAQAGICISRKLN